MKISKAKKEELMEIVLKKLDKIDEKLEKYDDKLGKIDVTLVKQNGSLDEHMRRSLAAEENLDLLKKEIKPISSHVYLMSVFGKIALVAMGGGAIFKLVELFFNRQ